ncbi:slit homolog 2 protein-like [Oppia nitens]|uniref:slit homolog 2 protein-like n=1 Tax=Oppia nitens TaxID=1686743 RepID=UPI0023D98B92|nr:slit homolog 2 protein-like [Oppia nitens]
MVIVPCSCAQYINQISCWNLKPDVNLTHIFVNLRKAVSNGNGADADDGLPIIYDEFKLIQSEFTELGTGAEAEDSGGGDFFAGIAFAKISITKNPRLRRIHSGVFRASSRTTTSLTISENPVLGNDPPNDRQIFQLINSFTGLTEVWLTDNNITRLPDRAFGRPQRSLSWLSLIDNNIESIGDYAFHGLPALNYLLLDGNRIDRISDKAFDFTDDSGSDGSGSDSSNQQLLRLFLRDNDLNDQSFADHTFDRLRRRLLIDLTKNNLTSLRPEVFAPVFRRNGSAVILRHNPLVCDCRFKWLHDRHLLYNSSDPDRHYFVHSVQCNGSRHDNHRLNELTDKHFQHCPQDDPQELQAINCFHNNGVDYDYHQCLNDDNNLLL